MGAALAGGAYVVSVLDGLVDVVRADDATRVQRVGEAVWLALNPSALFLLALGLFLVVASVRLLRGPEPTGTSGDADGATATGTDGRAAEGPVAVPPEALELEEGAVAACLRCGSVNMSPLTLSDGMFAMGGETLSWVCRRCNWRGTPLTFDDPTAYRAFVKALHEEPGPELIVDDGRT